MLVEEMQRFVVRGDERTWKPPEEVERRRALAKSAARQLADDDGMRRHPALLQQAREARDAVSKVLDPHRRVDQHHASRGARPAPGTGRRPSPPSGRSLTI